MASVNDPKWLVSLSRKLRWLAIPQMAIVFVSLQVLGFLLSQSDPTTIERLALIPEKVYAGEIWRVVSFLANPLSTSVIGILFAGFFGYFILNLIESEWGEVKTTLYILIALMITALFSLVFNYPVVNASGIGATLFLAAAVLFPQMTINIYMVLPVKMIHLGILAIAIALFQAFKGEWLDRFYLLAIYANFFLFFGPSLNYQFRQWQRRREYKSKWGR